MRIQHFGVVILSLAMAALSACEHDLDDGVDGFAPVDDFANLEMQGVYDCTERSDNGYRSGTRFSINVVKVDAKPVEVETANAYIAMQDAARRDGVNLRVVSGFRTNAEQQYLYGCYVNCNCNSCNLAARPGNSNHQSGHALDLNSSESGVSNWLNRNGGRFGFSRTVPSEPWHWEWWGGANDYDGPCGDHTPAPSTNVAPDDCDALAAEGGVIDDGDNCFTPGGPTQYLRSIDDAGHEGDLIWTGATANTNADNFGIWWVKVSEPGRYKLEVYVNRDYASSKQAKYSIRHNGRTDIATLDLTTAGNFRSLGEFEFSDGNAQRVRLDDNTGESSSAGKKIMFDALRVTRMDGQSAEPAPPPPATPTCTRVKVTTDGAALNVRPSASTSQAPRGTIANTTIVDRLSSAEGQEVRGNRTWFEVQKGSLRGYVSASYAVCQN
ncbi:MAG: D-alanyl-D-alanine carboxypeptidase family protein [Deltaproteobacteria bacterium]|nr:D-alanyl-D-alanine carboxypeptidase family protein [Deltaproteobacteria bacterium]